MKRSAAGKNVLKYDEVLNQQRTVIYAERRKVLNGEDLHDQIRNMLDDIVSAYVLAPPPRAYGAEDWDLDKLWTSLKQLYPVGMTVEDLIGEAGGEGPAWTPSCWRRASRRTPTPRTTAARRSSAPRAARARAPGAARR